MIVRIPTSVGSAPTPRKLGMRAHRSRSYREIEHEAVTARRLIIPGVRPEQGVNGVELFELIEERLCMNYAGRSIRVEVIATELPPSLPAFSLYDDTSDTIRVHVSEATYRGLEESKPRDLFTLCHELGHVCQHLTELIQLRRLPHIERALARAAHDHKIYLDTEWQADVFASAFMMPAQGLAILEAQHRWLDPELLMMSFNASHTAAQSRLRVFNQRRQDLLR